MGPLVPKESWLYSAATARIVPPAAVRGSLGTNPCLDGGGHYLFPVLKVLHFKQLLTGQRYDPCGYSFVGKYFFRLRA